MEVKAEAMLKNLELKTQEFITLVKENPFLNQNYLETGNDLKQKAETIPMNKKQQIDLTEAATENGLWTVLIGLLNRNDLDFDCMIKIYQMNDKFNYTLNLNHNEVIELFCTRIKEYPLDTKQQDAIFELGNSTFIKVMKEEVSNRLPTVITIR